MDPEFFPQPSPVECCNCKCSFSTMKKSSSEEHDVFKEEHESATPVLVWPKNARVEIANECMALRETVNNQQQIIQDLISELEEERNASSSAANEAMSMILKLQSEKSEIQMESRQFKRFAEEKMAHDQQQTQGLEELLYTSEQVIQALTCELQAYKHRMMSYGLTAAEADGLYSYTNLGGQYPPLMCKTKDVNEETTDIEKYAFEETPFSGDQLKDLEYRIDLLEKSPRTIQPDTEFRDTQSCSKKSKFRYIDEKSGSQEVDNDDICDRVCTIDSIYSTNGFVDSNVSGDENVHDPREPLDCSSERDVEIQKLYARLHALEADRETMRQSIIAIGADKAQMVLLKEIAQNLCKEMASKNTMPLRKQSLVWMFSFTSLLKRMFSIIFWRGRQRKCRFTFGLSATNVGLLQVLDRGGILSRRCTISTKLQDHIL